MAIPFFRKGPQVQEPSSGDKADSRASKPDANTSTLDFTQGDARALAQAAGKIQVDELSDADHPAVEEAAILFANASDDVAAAVLEAALDGGAEGNDTLWSMLFDLYRVVGQREAFEQRGVAYAEQFGRSPPIWAEEDTAPATKIASRDATPSVALTGTLGAAAKAQFDQISRIAIKAGKLRIDLGKLRGADEAGCEVLVSGLKALRQARVQVTILNARNMLPMIEGQAVQGQRQGQAIWLMVLELLQALAEVERFEEVALDYAITFEESPPSYEAPIAAPAPTMKNAEAVASASPALELVPIEEDAANFVIEGELTSAQSEVVRKLAKYGADRKTIAVDASRLRRMDFVTAGNLFNVLVQFQAQGKLCEIRGLNAMVAALLRVMGVHQVASMETRRI
ncbi:STAS domain-containing protein [Niveibacterium sp. 24ML]|uniref:STAS domain-containing protein n=1 Tax=Niveibacterium sp. 24ML TaxID=2985512 RepID=UPI00226D834A|nr:STAS domain-containing protein [Niveibacterium sp. 24ML]MCX9155372.1 STAS domain-containing protein [Niveibacterium sp. 24ML]